MSTPDGERSPKRQRLNSYSPASPHSHLSSVPPTTKTGGAPPQPNSFVHQPQTPPPSVRMSPSWNSQHSAPSQSDSASQQTGSGVSGESGAGVAGGRTSSSSGGPGSVTFPTPPSTVGLGTASGAPRSVDGEGKGMESEGETPSFSRESMVSGNGNDDVEMEGTAQYRPTDHERHYNPQQLDHEAMDTISDLPPAAPKLYKPPSYSNPSQPPHPIPPSQPHPNTNLLTLFNLTRLHSTIARKDAAGNKINKLRKSYEGKVKALGLQGSSRPVKGNAALQGLVDPAWDMEVGPEGETLWDAQRGGMMSGGEGGHGDGDGDGGGEHGSEGHRSRNVLENEKGVGGLIADFERVVADGLRPGRLPAPEHKRWEAVLGLNDSNAAANSGTAGKGAAGWARGRGAAGSGDDGSAGRNGNPPSVLSRTSAAAGAGSAGGMRASAPASPAAAGAGGSSRPERTGKKRRYDDASFDGYAQTFASSSAAGSGGAGLNTDDEGFSSSGGGGGGKRPRVGGGGDSGSGSQQSQQQQQRRVGAMASS